MSSVYRQSSDGNPRYAQLDPQNRLLWRQNIRRLEFEPLRDSILAIGGTIDKTIGGKPFNLADENSRRRTIYARIDRGSLPEVFNHFDFANPDMTSGKRYDTTVPQQALFMMNSPLVVELAKKLVNRKDFMALEKPEERIKLLYELIFQRPADEQDIEMGMGFIGESPADLYKSETVKVAFKPGQKGKGRNPSNSRDQKTGSARSLGKVCACPAADERGFVYRLILRCASNGPGGVVCQALSVCGRKPMNIVISGSSGLLGTALCAALPSAGHRVIRLVRGRGENESNTAVWDPMTGQIETASLSDVDGVIHLAGESIGSGRWTRAKKRRILESREIGTRLLAETVARMSPRPGVFLSASAIGFYGSRGDEILTEESSRGSDFLANVCRVWEEATKPASDAGVRVAQLRLGIVLSPDGGALGKNASSVQAWAWRSDRRRPAMDELGLRSRMSSGRFSMRWRRRGFKAPSISWRRAR